MTSGTEECKAQGKSCGTAAGWRYGGRCWRCRAAHKAENNRYRGLREGERDTVLSLLRSGHTAQEAADAIGKTPATLSGAAARDSELRAALDGQPEEYQYAARMGDYLAALTRTGGNRTQAADTAGIPRQTVQGWRVSSAAFVVAEDAVLALIKDVGITPRIKVTDAMIDRAIALLEDGATLEQAATSAGTTVSTLYYRARSHERLRTILETRPRRGGTSGLTAEVEQRLRELWEDADLSGRDIAQRLGVSYSTVTSWKRKLGLPHRTMERKKRKRSVLTPEAEATLRSLWADPQMTGEQIADKMDVHPSSVFKWAKHLELPARSPNRKSMPD